MNLKSLAVSSVVAISSLLPMSAQAAQTQSTCFVDSGGGDVCMEFIYNSNGTIYIKTAWWNDYSELGHKGFIDCSTGYITGSASTPQHKAAMEDFLRKSCEIAENR